MRSNYCCQNFLATVFTVFTTTKEELYTKTARISRQLVYRIRIIVNGCYWNTCLLKPTHGYTDLY